MAEGGGMTTCAGCQHLTHINRGTIPRTLCKRYRKPAIEKCLDYRGLPKPKNAGKGGAP
jgi:hypothetical protein